MQGSLGLAVLVSAAALSGCIDKDDVGPDGDAYPSADGLPVAPTPFTHLLCAGDEAQPLDGDHVEGCNQKATTDSGPAAEVSLAVNPRNPMNLVGGSKDFTLGEDPRCGKYSVWSGVYSSFDGGRSWDHALLPGYPGDPRTTALSDYACGSDPVVTFGHDGTVYYASIHVTQDPDDPPPVPQLAPVLGYPILNSGLAVTRSLDGGRTWEDPVLLHHVEDGSIIDKEWIAADPRTGTLYVTFILNGDFYLQRSDDGGVGWTEPAAMFEWGDGVTGPGTGQFGQVVVGPDSTVHFTYWGSGTAPTDSAAYHRSSTDRGATWSEAHRVALFEPVLDPGTTHPYRIVPMPVLAVDGGSGALYVSYPFFTGGAAAADAPADLDLFVAASTDGGETWGAPVRVNDDAVGPVNGQWMQAIAVGPDGTVHVTWLDYRDDPTGRSAYVYYAHSTDGAATFSPNVRVSDVAFDGMGGYHQSGAGTIGDYMGLAVSAHAVHPFWADTREGRNDVFGAIILAGG